ncbi:MAG: helix-turn-helix transcriptional regulator [Nitrospira sp.]|nr:helix-turn-helix transcriptional regulator [Nitrospira sp.]
MTYKAFSQRVGLPPSTLFRLEQGGQSITLGRLHLVMSRLKCTLKDIFPND